MQVIFIPATRHRIFMDEKTDLHKDSKLNAILGLTIGERYAFVLEVKHFLNLMAVVV